MFSTKHNIIHYYGKCMQWNFNTKNDAGSKDGRTINIHKKSHTLRKPRAKQKNNENKWRLTFALSITLLSGLRIVVVLPSRWFSGTKSLCLMIYLDLTVGSFTWKRHCKWWYCLSIYKTSGTWIVTMNRFT